MGYRKRGHIHKVCGCPRAKWLKCSHPWHFAFQHQRQPYRFSLNREAGKPPGYVISKTEAETLAGEYRQQIRAGTFRQTPPASVAASGDLADTRVTFGYVADQYLEQYVPFDQRHGGPRREAGRRLMEWYVNALKRARIPAGDGTTVMLDTKPVAAITKADVEAIRSGWKLRTTGSRGGQVGPNRALKRLRHLFGWAIEQGHIEATPFKKGDKVVIHIPRDRKRTRRLEPGEEELLLRHADPWLHALIVGLLETGCRVGELLALTWADVKWAQNVLLIRDEIAKDGETRDVPMTKRLKAVLEMRQHAADGSTCPLTAHMFGDAVGSAGEVRARAVGAAVRGSDD